MSLFLKAMNSNNATTHNGAVCHSTTGSHTLDYFSTCGTFRGRSEAEVFRDMEKIFAEDEVMALKVVFYNRMITRKVKNLGDKETESVQRGQGQKDEFIKSLKWLELYKPELLMNNLFLVPLVGCYKDLWYDSSSSGYTHYLDTKYVFPLIKIAISSDSQRALVAKYLPKIRSSSNTHNDRHRRKNEWAKKLCKYLGWSTEQYRKFKSSPENNAHLWQRKMSSGDWDSIRFEEIPGKALFSLINHTGKDGKTTVERRSLTDKAMKWISSSKTAKFTGYPYELYDAAIKAGSSQLKNLVLDAQFEELLKKGRDKSSNLLKRGVLCALDTSASMSSFRFYGNTNSNVDTSPLSICLGLGLYFSSLIEGYFKDHVIMFDSRSRMLKLNGTFTQKVRQLPMNSMGSTNFQSVIDEIVRVRTQNPTVSVEEYPQILLVVSDMQMDATASRQSNYDSAMSKLAAVGLPKMTIIWWNVNGHKGTCPNKLDDEGVVMISGFDGSSLSLLLNSDEKRVVDEKTGEQRKLNAQEHMVEVLNQEILNMVEKS